MLMAGVDPLNIPYLWALGTRADGSGLIRVWSFSPRVSVTRNMVCSGN